MKSRLFAILLLVGAVGLPVASTAEPDGVLPLAITNVAASTAGLLLDLDAEAWRQAPQSPVHLNRTPPLYLGDPSDDGARPQLRVKLARAGDGGVVLWVRWSDESRDEPPLAARLPDAGDDHIYHQHPGSLDSFADAFCVMLPVERAPQRSYPSMMMGEKDKPVDLYFWQAGAGFQVLSGHGRATTAPTAQPGETPAGQARHADGAWTLTLALGDLPAGVPLCFAIWDGRRQQRDGLKYFSLWHEAR